VSSHRTTFGSSSTPRLRQVPDLALEKSTIRLGSARRSPPAGSPLGSASPACPSPLVPGNPVSTTSSHKIRLRELRVHPSGKPCSRSAPRPGPGTRDHVRPDRHPRAGHSRDDILVQHGDTDNTRSPGHLRLPVDPTPAPRRHGRPKVLQGQEARRHLLEVSEEDVSGSWGASTSARPPTVGVTIRTAPPRLHQHAAVSRAGSRDNAYYDPPNMTGRSTST